MQTKTTSTIRVRVVKIQMRSSTSSQVRNKDPCVEVSVKRGLQTQSAVDMVPGLEVKDFAMARFVLMEKKESL